MRALTLCELELIVGGGGDGSTELTQITVTGMRPTGGHVTYLPSGGNPAGGGPTGGGGSTPVNLVLPPQHPTAHQIGNILYREAQGVDAQHRSAVMSDIAHIIINDEGGHEQVQSSSSDPNVSTMTSAQVAIYNQAQSIAQQAVTDAANGVDPTHGDTTYGFYVTPPSSYNGAAVNTIVGPFSASGTPYKYFVASPAQVSYTGT